MFTRHSLGRSLRLRRQRLDNDVSSKQALGKIDALGNVTAPSSDTSHNPSWNTLFLAASGCHHSCL